MPGTRPKQIWLYRLIHIDNLSVLLSRDALHAPNATPQDGLAYRPIHDVSVQEGRRIQPVPCGPGGSVHDYVPFYFGTHSPMLLKLKSGQVDGFHEGQEPLLYLVTRLDDVLAAGARFVFSDGHGLARFTDWFDQVTDLDRVDWRLVGERFWRDTHDDNDRMRRKQAEFLVWHSLPWSAIYGIATFSDTARERTAAVLARFPHRHQPELKTIRGWYY
jgi:hypothetical protein